MNRWWAVPEGTIGQLLSGVGSIFTGHGTKIDLYHVVESASKPAGNKQNPVYGPYATQAAAQAQASGLNGIAGQASQAGAAADPGAPPGANAQGPSDPLAAVDDFLHRLSEGNTWLRVGEVLLGIVLIAVGLARITGTQNTVSQLVKARIP